MLIEDNYYESSFNEDRYDYLFKGRAKQQRQQKREQPKAPSPVRKITAPVRKVKSFVQKTVKTVVAAPAAARTLVRTNFGMLDKNKKVVPAKRPVRRPFIKRPAPAPAPLPPPPPPVAEEIPESPLVENNLDNQDTNQQVSYPDSNTASEGAEYPASSEEQYPEENTPEPSEEPEPEAETPSEESSFNEPEKGGTTKSKQKEGSGVGAFFGWACLGLTVLGIAYLISREPDGAELTKQVA